MVSRWLQDFRSKKTPETYMAGLKLFAQVMGNQPENWENWIAGYVESQPDEEQRINDFKEFLASMEDKPPKTVITYAQAVRGFLADHKLKIPDDEWKKIRRRRQIRSVVITQDKAPTHDELRRILNYLDVKGRALVLFLVSSGCRIGETLALRTEDLKLEEDPPQALIRTMTTKKGESGRTVGMSYEARDALKDWLKVKSEKKKPSNLGGERYSVDKVFGIVPSSARGIWTRAVEKAGLDQRDPATKRLVLHIHSLRKFYRSNIGLDRDLIDALMGHKGYLDDAYRRFTHRKIMDQYIDAMPNLSLYHAEAPDEVEAFLRKLKRDGKMNELREKLGIGSAPGVQHSLEGGAISDRIVNGARISGESVATPTPPPQIRDEGRSAKPVQKVIRQDEVKQCLADGWRFVDRLNGDEIIVEK